MSFDARNKEETLKTWNFIEEHFRHLNGTLSGLNERISHLNTNIKDFNQKSGRLSFWLIIWTAVIAIATIANVFAAAHWWPFQ